MGVGVSATQFASKGESGEQVATRSAACEEELHATPLTRESNKTVGVFTARRAQAARQRHAAD